MSSHPALLDELSELDADAMTPLEALINLHQLSTNYGGLFIVGNRMRELESDPSDQFARREVVEWLRKVTPSLRLLRKLDSRRRLVQFADLLLGRSAPTLSEEEAAVEDPVDEIIRNVQEFAAKEAKRGFGEGQRTS